MPRVQVRPESLTVLHIPCSVRECAATRILNARCSLQNVTQSVTFTILFTDGRGRQGETKKPLQFITVCLAEPADFRRAHPPGQIGFGAKVSAGSYLTWTPAPSPANGRPEMSQPLVLNQQRRAAETAACQDGAGLNYPHSRRDMGQLPQFVRQGEERKVKKSLLWERKPVVFLLSLIRTWCWRKIDGINELINGNRDGKAKLCLCFPAEWKRCNMCLLSQAQEVAETRWNRIIWPFTAQAHQKKFHQSQMRFLPRLHRGNCQIRSSPGSPLNQGRTLQCLGHTSHKCYKSWASQEAAAEGF